MKESARIPTSFPKSDYTKAVIKKLIFAFSICAFLASPRAFSICAFLAFPKLHDEILVAPRSDRYILDIALGHALDILNILLRILGQLIKAAAA